MYVRVCGFREAIAIYELFLLLLWCWWWWLIVYLTQCYSPFASNDRRYKSIPCHVYVVMLTFLSLTPTTPSPPLVNIFLTNSHPLFWSGNLPFTGYILLV